MMRILVRLTFAPRRRIRNTTLCLAALFSFGADSIQARPWRPGQIPNGTVFNCANCHVSPAGGGPRNAFGNAVLQFVAPGSTAPFWNATLAARDSDGDGFTNGQELGDLDGDGVPIPGAQVTNPGIASSRPNSPPRFTSTPPTNAVMGLVYEYQAAASDADSDTIAFIKLAGPDWLSVSSSGLASGTPREGEGGIVTVTLRARDSKSPAATEDQSFTLAVRASFTGWQQLRFSLPSEQALAARDADPDGDGLPNFIEYALRLEPKNPDPIPFPLVRFNASDQLTLSIETRDDDPELDVFAEFSDDVSFESPSVVEGRPGEERPGTGLRPLEFTDSVSRASVRQRFARLRFTLKF